MNRDKTWLLSDHITVTLHTAILQTCARMLTLTVHTGVLRQHNTAAGVLQDLSLWSRTPSAIRKAPIPHQAYYCLLGHLYAAARLELMRMGHSLNLSHYTPAGPAHGNVSSPHRFLPTLKFGL